MSVYDDIKARLDIVDVVSPHVSLQKSGQGFKGLCPFHSEKTPSFSVSPERQSWRCFGACATGGDAFAFVMRRENVEFPDALRILARRAGVELSPQGKRQRDRRDALLAANRIAAGFYHERLKSPEGAHALRYLTRRGVNAAAIDAFQLGYSPNEWDGLGGYLSVMGVPLDDAVEAGLIRRDENSGRTWDFFRGRLMFPIHGPDGEPLGFGGRQLDEPQLDSQGYNPKYVNTSATPVFDKRSVLYGLHLARAAIREGGSGVIVEGYMDAIAAHQRGYRNVVASMGVALTESQVGRLKSLANKFVLALDPDAAGQEATLRSLEASWKVIGEQSAGRAALGALHRRDAVSLSVAALPQGKDPHDLITESAAEWERITENAQPLMSYIIPAMAARFDISTGQGKSQVVDAVYPLIAATQNIYDRQRYEQDLADALGIGLDTLMAGLRQRRPQQSPNSRRRAPQAPRPAPRPADTAFMGNPDEVRETYLLTLLLSRPALRDDLADFPAECFRNSAHREIFARWMRCAAIDDLQAGLDETLREHAQALLSAEMPPADAAESRRALDECARLLKRRHYLELQQALLATEDAASPPARELAAQAADLNAGIRTAETASASALGQPP